MGKIYSPPESIGEPPSITHPFDWKAYNKACDEYVNKIKSWAKQNGKGPQAGEEISFGVADGNAVYIVVSLSPVSLIHVPIGDAYQFQYANRLTRQDILKKIEQKKALARMFENKESY
jgi:hypothetical protein